ncbi:MAG: DNA-binding helix-turn-helix protein [Clostridia bacterium]|jgi:transcriptional regulator with XRE-family HTH domain|nr:DNA-binding helix-turn-helix protein [Clostridia bacterium]
MKFHDRLRDLRVETDLNQKEFSHKIGMPYTTYNGYESGKREPDIETLKMLSNYFNVSLDYLLGRVDQRTFVIHKDNVDGHEIEYSLDKDKYPDGLTHEEVLEVLENFKKMGMDFSKFKKD